ncbi:MAG: hypothetical protein RBS17_07465 [Coriobacteriia bacterium]|nr:hypothetical protein [Coriobacteriia bacterium]
MSEYYVWLCYKYLDLGRYEVEAIYDNDAQAEAWLAGVNAAYGRGYIMCVDANEGPIDFDKWREEADHE